MDDLKAGHDAEHKTAAISTAAVKRTAFRKQDAVVFTIILFAVAFAHTVYTSSVRYDPANAMRCAMAYMSPSYVRQDGFNRNHSRLAGKYSLWLYREQGYDLSDKPHGIPVLFAPGNAGSYRQVRSLAAAAARQYYDNPGRPHSALFESGIREMDWFAADFNEDFSAFHAATLREQAKYLADAITYILSLYPDDSSNYATKPTSVIIVAHSMGGIAARLLLLRKDIPAASVKTIITLSTPHMLPPAAVDSGIDEIYSEINGFWQNEYTKAGSGKLDDVLLISIAGGTADTTVSSDYASIASFTPASNGFTVMTTTIPTVRSPVDHLAMVWCDQLRQTIISALLRTIDVNRPDRVRPVATRLDIMKSYLVSGIETHTQMIDAADEQVIFTLDDFVWSDEATSDIRDLAQNGMAVRTHGHARMLQALTITSVGAPPLAYGCEDTRTGLRCKSQLQMEHVRQAVMGNDGLPLREGMQGLFSTAPLGATSEVILFPRQDARLVYFISNDGLLVQKDTVTLLKLVLLGHILQFPPGTVASTVVLPNIGSSLLVFRLSPQHVPCRDASFSSLCAYNTGMHERKYLPMDRPISIHLHSPAPFLSREEPADSLHIQIFRPPTCVVHLRISISWKESFGTLLLRYRTVVAAWPALCAIAFLQAVLVAPPSPGDREFRAQTFLWRFHDTMIRALVKCSLLALLVASGQALAPVYAFKRYTRHFLLGTDLFVLSILAPALLAVCGAVVAVLNVLVLCLLYTLTKFWHHPKITKSSETILQSGRLSRSRIISFILLGLFILFFAPHQFAFLVVTLLQIYSTAKALVTLKRTSTTENLNRFQINYAVLLLLLILLPLNATILLVWLRNLQAGWYAPFASDHNILRIAGPFLVVEHLQRGGTVYLPRNGYLRHSVSLLAMTACSLILVLGVRFTFIVADLANYVLLMVYVAAYCSRQ